MKSTSNIEVSFVKFLDYCRHGKRLAKETLRAYEKDMEKFQLFLEEKYPEVELVTQLSKPVLLDYIAFLNQQFAVKTVKRKCATLRSYFHYLDDCELIDRNPFDKIRVQIREPQKLPHVMTLQQIRDILAAVYNEKFGNEWCGSAEMSDLIYHRNIAVLELLFSTGLRVHELCNLKHTDLNWQERSLMILGKGSKERMIHIGSDEVLKALKEYIIRLKKIGVESPYIFISRFREKMSTQAVRNLVTKYAQMAGVYIKITPHTFRHTFASLLLEEGVDIKYIQEFLGHSSISTTQIYLHISSSSARHVLTTMHPRTKMTMVAEEEAQKAQEEQPAMLAEDSAFLKNAVHPEIILPVKATAATKTAVIPKTTALVPTAD